MKNFRQEILNQIPERGATRGQISEQVSCTPMTVTRWLQKLVKEGVLYKDYPPHKIFNHNKQYKPRIDHKSVYYVKEKMYRD